MFSVAREKTHAQVSFQAISFPFSISHHARVTSRGKFAYKKILIYQERNEIRKSYQRQSL